MVDWPSLAREPPGDWGRSFEAAVPSPFNVAYYTCRRHDDGTALVGESSVSFRRLDRLSDRAASWLATRGVGRGDVVWVELPSGPATVAWCQGCWKRGAVVVPASPKLGTAERRRRIDRCRPDAVVHTPATTVPTDGPALAVAGLDELTRVGDDERMPVAPTAPDDPAVISFTSGSTGRPKGVIHTHDYLLGYLPGRLQHGTTGRLADDAVMWAIGDVAWIAPLSSVLVASFLGRTAVVTDGFGPVEICRTVRRHGVTNLFAPPTAVRRLLRDDRADVTDLAGVETVLCGGEPHDAAFARRLDERLPATVNFGYGQSEVNMIAGETADERRPGSVGRPTVGRTVRIVDPATDERVPRGTTGEILVRSRDGLAVTSGYLDAPDPFARLDGHRWVRTGDRGYRDADGFLFVEGRLDDTLVSAGHPVAPAAVERAVRAHDAVMDCTVTTQPHPTRGAVPAVTVELADHSPTNIRDRLRSLVRRRLGGHVVVGRIDLR